MVPPDQTLTASLEEHSHAKHRVIRASQDRRRKAEYRRNHKTTDAPIEMKRCPALNLDLGDGEPNAAGVESTADVTWRGRRDDRLNIE